MNEISESITQFYEFGLGPNPNVVW